jgi:hypothetical protein
MTSRHSFGINRTGTAARRAAYSPRSMISLLTLLYYSHTSHPHTMPALQSALAPFTLKGFYLLTWGTALGANVWNTLVSWLNNWHRHRRTCLPREGDAMRVVGCCDLAVRSVSGEADEWTRRRLNWASGERLVPDHATGKAMEGSGMNRDRAGVISWPVGRSSIRGRCCGSDGHPCGADDAAWRAPGTASTVDYPGCRCRCRRPSRISCKRHPIKTLVTGLSIPVLSPRIPPVKIAL